MRRIYLYLALFISVIGGMISAGSLVYLLFNALLGGGASNILQNSLKALELLALFALLGDLSRPDHAPGRENRRARPDRKSMPLFRS